jgi:hypothetical protein
MTTEPARRLLQVKPGKFVYLPSRLITQQRGKDRIWLKPGVVIDATDPFVTHCLLGQDFKLGPAPAGAQPDAQAMAHPLIRAYRKELARKAEPPKPNPKKEAAKAAAAQVGLSAGIQAPDEVPPKPKEREPGPFDVQPPEVEPGQGELIPDAEESELNPQPRKRGKK